MKRSLTPLFFPGSVAVIGASSRPGSLGGAVLKNLLEGGYPGTVHAVHPDESEVLGVRIRSSVNDLPEAPDLAVWAVPAGTVEAELPRLLERGTRASVVITAGFSETGEEGRIREERLVRMSREHDAVLLGPNCLGLHVATHTGRLDLSFSRVRPDPGHTVVLSQSGSIAEWLMIRFAERGLGASLVVSYGNGADLDLPHLVEGVAEHFPDTRQALVYFERLPRDGDLDVLTGLPADCRLLGLIGGHDREAEGPDRRHGLVSKAGGLLVDSMLEAVDAVEVLDRLDPPGGRRVAVITNAGGPALLAADELRRQGLTLPPPSPSLTRRVQGHVHEAAILGNPFDLLAPAHPEAFRNTLCEIDASDEYDAILAVFMHPLMTDATEMAAALEETLADGRHPGITCWLGDRDTVLALRRAGLPVIPEPTRAARALAHWAADPTSRSSP